MKKHPVIFGLFLVFVSGVALLLILRVMVALLGDGVFFSQNEKVGIINISGIISSSREVVEQLEEFGKDDRIKALVVRIDSPGGGVAASQEIYAAIKRLKNNKKVVASLGSVAASGGYMIACAADKIVANPGTLTGSISVIMYFANTEDLFKKIGLKSSVIKSGKYKDIGSPTREMTEDEKQLLQALVDDIYNQFVAVIAHDRNIPQEKVLPFADGRVFSGRQAQVLRLVDYLGDKSYAVQLAGKMADIKGTPEVLYAKKRDVSLWEFILQTTFVSVINNLKGEINVIPHGINLLYEYGA
ncbi:MAG: signal peptide peptidase SppA [Syntrophales bacterium]